jgi:hypothetical protein
MPVIPQVGLGRSAVELKAQRANTLAFIEANLSLVTLTPYTRSSTGSGTRLSALPDRPTQKARIVDQFGGFSTAGGRQTGADATERQVEYQMIMLWDADVGKNDRWTDVETGERWEVWDMLPDNGYEKRVKVRRYGEG